VFAVQIVGPDEGGRVLLLGKISLSEPSPERSADVERVIERAHQTEGRRPAGLMYLAGVLKGLNEAVQRVQPAKDS
jgi:hypothetical protein